MIIGLSIKSPTFGPEQIQTFSSPGHADIKQPSLLLHIRTQTFQIQRQDILFTSDDKNDGKLQPLGRVKSHQGKFFSIEGNFSTPVRTDLIRIVLYGRTGTGDMVRDPASLQGLLQNKTLAIQPIKNGDIAKTVPGLFIHSHPSLV